MSEHAASKTVGPGFVVRVAGRSLVGVARAEFVPGVEIVVDLRVDLLPAETGEARDTSSIRSKNTFGAAAFVACPAEARRVQTIAADSFVIVRQRHLAEHL